MKEFDISGLQYRP